MWIWKTPLHTLCWPLKAGKETLSLNHCRHNRHISLGRKVPCCAARTQRDILHCLVPLCRCWSKPVVELSRSFCICWGSLPTPKRWGWKRPQHWRTTQYLTQPKQTTWQFSRAHEASVGGWDKWSERNSPELEFPPALSVLFEAVRREEISLSVRLAIWDLNSINIKLYLPPTCWNVRRPTGVHFRY